MAERKEYTQGRLLSKSAAQREYSHIKRVIQQRNRRVTLARQEETRKKKAEERAERAREAAEAKRREEEERERLRQANVSRQSLPRAASIAARSSIPVEAPGTGERLPMGGRMSTSDVGSASVNFEEVRRDVQDEPPVADPANILAGIDGVRPQPRGSGRQLPQTFQNLIDAMVMPEDENATPAEILAAILQNQINMANQNAAIMRAIESNKEVRMSV